VTNRLGIAETTPQVLFGGAEAQQLASRSTISAVLLNGWKEISAYLRCGVRTAQRWTGAGLPVRRVGTSKRGPVMAFSEKLDAWVQRSGSPTGDRQTDDIFEDLRKTLSKTAELMEAARQHQRTFLAVEIATGLRMAAIARVSDAPGAKARRTAEARRAYEEANKWLSGVSLYTQERKLEAQLRTLERALQDLGEKF